ncbi:unnamed protein product [Ilex paraguariensis]|uniref:Altered inheritance of mitochondria protein 24, mitochondrial n=1 Tax=Ilex paraguariensis TaxID=185542 RepID=A0ABC8UVD8_9AQUA
MLKPQEKEIAKPGSMCYMPGSVVLEHVFPPEHEPGMWQWLFGKRVTSIVFSNVGPSDGFVGIAAPSLARILPIDLAVLGGEMLCQPDAFLCSISDVKVSNVVDQRVRNVIATAESFLRQKISGRGLAFIVGGGTVVQKNLEVGEVLSVDMSSIVALSATINVQVKYNAPMRRVVFGPSLPKLFALLASPIASRGGGARLIEYVIPISMFSLQNATSGSCRLRLDATFCLFADHRSTTTSFPLNRGLFAVALEVPGMQKDFSSNFIFSSHSSCRVGVFPFVMTNWWTDSGDNLMTAVLTGPGIVFIQSMAFHRLSQRIARAVASPNMRDNPKFLIQVAIFLFLVYVVVVSSFILTDI